MRKKIIKKLSCAVIVSSIASTASAVIDAGGYFGFMLGQSNFHAQSIPVTLPPLGTTLTLKPNGGKGVGVRFFGGYNMNVWSAFEAGFTIYTPLSYTLNSTSTIPASNNVKTHAGSVDVDLKGMLPFWDSGFSIFGKLGLAYFYSKTSGSITFNSQKFSFKTTDSGARPLLGIGVSYDMTPNWVVDLSYTRIQFSSKVIKNPDLIALGFHYHLVDAMCGQFLC